MGKSKSGMVVEQRYGALRAIATFFMVLGVLVGILGVIGSIGSFVALSSQGMALEGIGSVVGGIFGTIILVVQFIATSNIIKAFIDTEENTRRTYMMIEQLARIQARALQQ